MKLDPEQIKLINALDAISRVSAKDCFVEGNRVVFLVPSEKIAQAIGKKGATVENARKVLKKEIEMYEYFEEPEKFFEKAFLKAKTEKVEVKTTGEKKIAFVKADAENKKLILRNMGRLNRIKELAKRNYDIDEVRIR